MTTFAYNSLRVGWDWHNRHFGGPQESQRLLGEGDSGGPQILPNIFVGRQSDCKQECLRHTQDEAMLSVVLLSRTQNDSTPSP